MSKVCPFCNQKQYGIDYKIMSIYKSLTPEGKQEALRFYQFLLQERIKNK